MSRQEKGYCMTFGKQGHKSFEYPDIRKNNCNNYKKPGAQQYQQRWSVAGAAQWVHYAKDSPNKDMEIGLFVRMGHYPSEFPMGELIEPTKMKIKRETFVEHEKRMSPNKTKVEKETSVK